MLWLTPLSHHGRLCARAFVYGITTISEDTAAKKRLSINVISALHCSLVRTLPTLLIEATFPRISLVSPLSEAMTIPLGHTIAVTVEAGQI